jgi:hypothetical protein
MMKTTTPVLLRDQRTGSLVHHPRTGKVLTLPSKKYKEKLAALKKEYPNGAWEHYDFDYRGMASAREMRRMPAIEATMEMLRAANAETRGREFIITARSSENIPVAFDAYVSEHDVELDGVFPVNAQSMLDTLGIDPALGTPFKKAIVMAALIDLYGPAPMKTVRFLLYRYSRFAKVMSFYCRRESCLQCARVCLMLRRCFHSSG